MNPVLASELAAFDAAHIGLSKGPLSLAITLTRKAAEKEFPLNSDDWLTGKKGQVAGLGGGILSSILKDHGITRTLSSEGGRTSRGNMDRMVVFVDFLNKLFARGLLDLPAIETYWAKRIEVYFDSKPFVFKLDSSQSLRSSVKDLFAQAIARQKEVRGTMYAGAVMQHLVGAKLDLIKPGEQVKHNGFSTADAPTARSGDFLIDDVCIHVTTAPGEPLIKKCQANLAAGLRPLIVTTDDGIYGARAFAKQAGIEDRIDVIEIEQFIATNIYERSGFSRGERRKTIRALIDNYNALIDKNETDPSLRIEFEE